jgi:hypothetical protein
MVGQGFCFRGVQDGSHPSSTPRTAVVGSCRGNGFITRARIPLSTDEGRGQARQGGDGDASRSWHRFFTTSVRSRRRARNAVRLAQVIRWGLHQRPTAPATPRAGAKGGEEVHGLSKRPSPVMFRPEARTRELRSVRPFANRVDRAGYGKRLPNERKPWVQGSLST